MGSEVLEGLLISGLFESWVAVPCVGIFVGVWLVVMRPGLFVKEVCFRNKRVFEDDGCVVS